MPAKDQVRIYYNSDHSYEPDFIVETMAEKLMCEPKRASELQDQIVQAKARAAISCAEMRRGTRAEWRKALELSFDSARRGYSERHIAVVHELP